MPLMAFETPTWVFYRRMDFRRTRLLESIRPVVMFIVTVPLAAFGAGFWSLFIGSIAGVVARALATVFVSPYKLRFRYERGAAREYTSYSWPVFAGALMWMVTFHVPLTIAARGLGAAAVGAITLSAQVVGYTRRVDEIVTDALYPAICAVRDRRDLLFESFSKSNRLAVLWGFPLGIGASLFAADLVYAVLGERVDWLRRKRLGSESGARRASIPLSTGPRLPERGGRRGSWLSIAPSSSSPSSGLACRS